MTVCNTVCPTPPFASSRSKAGSDHTIARGCSAALVTHTVCQWLQGSPAAGHNMAAGPPTESPQNPVFNGYLFTVGV
eukprot:6949516-Alexandrium_andersonii.AAC.1